MGIALGVSASESTSLLAEPGTNIPARTILLPFHRHARAVCTVALLILLISFFSMFLPSDPSSQKEPSPTSLEDIFLHGPILHAVQTAQVLSDGKEFVDMPLKAHPSQVQAAFDSLPSHDKETLTTFLHDYFAPVNSDIVRVKPSDFQLTPPTINTVIQNTTLREWALAVHKIWCDLGRKPSEKENFYSTLIPSKNMLIVPGGRFRESYYWDTYWIIAGLLASDMVQTAKGIVENFLQYIDLYGHVPNGGRIYYLKRSQPPLLSDMIRLIYNKTGDIQFVENSLSLLRKEYDFWMTSGENGHAVSIPVDENSHQMVILNRYVSPVRKPRPESYREDVETAHLVPEEQRGEVYRNIRAAAESGWDFSSRWYSGEDLVSTSTASVIPVGLNSIMYRFEKNLQRFHELTGDETHATKFKHAAEARKYAIDRFLWSEEDKMWKDYFLSTKSHSDVMSVANFYPLWAGCYSQDDEELKKAILATFKNSGLVQPGGVSTTTNESGQQWDQPNAWPPLQDIVVEGLLGMGLAESEELANDLIDRWIETQLIAWNKNGYMYEKYDASEVGFGGGHGGEYRVQVGFGWTNGVVLKFLTEFPEKF